MHHPCFFATRSRAVRLAAASGVLLVSGLVLALPQHSAAQDPQQNRPPASSGTDQAGSNSYGDGSNSNPPVGIDTTGRADAVATRNGRTTRQSVPSTPINPLVLVDPSRNPNPDVTSDYNPDYSQNAGPNYQYQPLVPAPPAPGNRLIPPIVTRPPGDYTVLTDPSSLGPRRYAKPLPLFGYDFFQPARQIIVARRRALLPIVPRVNRYSNNGNNYGNNSRQGQPGNFGNGSYSNGTYPPRPNNGYVDGSNNISNYNNTGNYNSSDNNATGDAAMLGAGAALGAAGQSQRGGYSQPGGGYGTDPNQPGSQNQTDTQTPDGGGYPNSNSTGNTDNSGSRGQVPSSRTNSNNYDPSSSSDNNYDGSAYNNDPLSTDTLNNDPLNGDVTSSTVLRRRPMTNQGNYDDQGQNVQDQNSPYQYSQYPNSQYPRSQYPNSQYPNGSNRDGSGYPSVGDGFPEDASTPMGSDIQFPGDDALVQNGSANAVTGQIADPISTLYKNVLASLPSNYQLQPGDSLTIRYSALTLAPREFTTAVDLQGGIDIAGVGRISVAGRTASQAEDTLRQRLARLYRNVDVSINLRQLRTIQVTVSGAAFAPGTYTVPATATAFNILNAAGGPTADGSLRDIRVLRSGRLVGSLDIYPLIGATTANPGARNGDIALQAGDNIYIPGRLSRISVRGEVRQQAIYELTPKETLADALRYAGGIKPSGVDQTVHIDTIDNGRDRIIKDVSLRDKAKVAAVPIYDGDTIDVSSIRSILTNRVTISGAVDQPGDYALTSGMTVADLLARARGPLYNAYLDQADLIRLNPDNTTTRVHLSIAQVLDGDPKQNIPLKRFDILRLYTRQEVAYLGRRLVTVRGAVQRPGLYTQSDNMHVSDLLLDSGGPLPDAYLNRAVLLHQRGDGTYAYDYISLTGILAGDASADLPVDDNDVLAVYRIGEAHFTPDHTVKVLGNVVAPGLYARGDNMRLSDLLKLAGAFKPGGGTRVTIAHARRPITDQIQQIAPETVAYTANQTVALGNDLVLQDGDVVAVQGNGTLQDHPAVVTVTGMVNRPGPIIIQQGMHLSDAIKQAGGLRPEAFPQGAEFTRTSDALATTGQLDLATIIVRMSDMLNLSQYQREHAKANLALIEAAGAAGSGSSSGLAIPGLGGGGSNAANPNLAPLIATLPSNNPVSPARLLTPSQLRPNGGVAVQLAQALKRPGSIEDVLLKDGDTLVVPETPTTVQVVGAVYSGRGVVFRPGQSIDYYIQLVGGFTPDAARDRIEVIHAGGGLIPADKAGALQPGDLILVPTKVLAEKIGRSGNGFADFFQALVGSAITLKVLSSVFGL